MKFQMTNFKLRMPGISAGGAARFGIRRPKFAIRNFFAFTLIEVMVVVSLMSLIVLALMAVFSTTQRAFRAAVTQTDVLEGGRAVMDLMAADLRGLTPSDDGYSSGAVNFFITNNASYSQPLVQPLPPGNVSRSNLLQEVFILNHQNTGWWGVGYAVSTNASGSLYSLYRLQYPSPPGTNDPTGIFNSLAFQNFFSNPTNGGSHLLDGVVHFAVRAYDPNGIWIAPGYARYTNFLNEATLPFTLVGGEAGFAMYSNAVPASVELELGVLEDAALSRAESLSQNYTAQTNYLAGQAGAVHLFRQRVTIPNFDSAAYQ
jgi:type II secretory pathway pseudopilin PulG